ncbi:MAG TPA: NB-ARC domain-containing protein [Chloroflexia bacterium]|nr:NB-ARC domain-containing protein [Chloroflexia bacterium]
MSVKIFKAKLREYLRQSGYSQKQLAYELGMHPAQLSNKLNDHNYASLTYSDVKQIVKILAQWQAIISQPQALELLASMNLTYSSFSQAEWQQPPLDQLELALPGKPLRPEAGLNPPYNNFQTESTGPKPSGVKVNNHNSPPTPADVSTVSPFKAQTLGLSPIPLGVPSRRDNWQDVIPTGPFYGREKEINNLNHWIVEEHCQLLAVLGMGGIGKTALAFRLVQQLKTHFQFVIWHSLHNAPPLQNLLRDLLQSLAAPEPVDLSGGVESNLRTLLAYMQTSRVLLVLDNWETLLQEGRQDRAYRSGYEDYGRLLEQIGQINHQSCLILTSRENPRELGLLEIKAGGRTVRSIELSGLGAGEAQYILHDLGLVSSAESQSALVKRYSGNPLALKLVTEIVQTLFGGKVEDFLAEEWTIFGEIEEVLEHQLKRLSELEQQVVYWLALSREPLSLQELNRDLILPHFGKEIAETIISLARRHLLEREQDQPRFGLQPVVLEYLTQQVVEQATSELITGQFKLIQSLALLKAEAKDYIKNSQRRLILDTILEKLLIRFAEKNKLEAHLGQLLKQVREQPFAQQGYSGGNLFNLLRVLKDNLNDYDFSGLRLWQADLQGLELHKVNFTGSDLGRSAFTQSFESVTSLDFSPDGQLVAGGCYDGEIRVWEVSSGQQLLECKGHQGVVWSVAFSPDGKWLASGSLDHTVKLWDVASGECYMSLEGHTNWIWSVAFSPDGKHLASGSLDHTVKLWKLPGGTCIETLQRHEGEVWAVAFSPDGKLLASASADQTIKLWEVPSAGCLGTLQGHTDWVMSVAFSPDGHFLASGSNDRTLRLWEVTSGVCTRALEGHTNTVYSVAFSPDGKKLASGSLDQTIKLWQVESGVCLKTLQGHTSWVWSVAFSPDGKWLASGGTDQSIKLWQVESGVCLKTLQGHTNWTYTVAFSPDGKWLASGGTDHNLKLWEVTNGTFLRTLQGHTDTVMSVAFSPDGKWLASGSLDQTIKLWEASSGTCLTTLGGHANSIWSLAFSPDGKWLASGSTDHSIKLWEVDSGVCLKTLEGHTNWIYSVAFSPDGKWLASGSLDCSIRLWEVNSGICLKTLEGHPSEIRTLAFSPDGKWLASGSIDRTIKLWEVSTGTCLKTLVGHSNWVYSVAFSPDGKWLASGSTDQTIKLWEVTTGTCLKTLKGHDKLVRVVAFSPDGQLLVSAGNDQAIKLWEVASGTCLKTLQALRPYEGMNISRVTGITEAQSANLKALGAILVA